MFKNVKILHSKNNSLIFNKLFLEGISELREAKNITENTINIPLTAISAVGDAINIHGDAISAYGDAINKLGDAKNIQIDVKNEHGDAFDKTENDSLDVFLKSPYQ